MNPAQHTIEPPGMKTVSPESGVVSSSDHQIAKLKVTP